MNSQEKLQENIAEAIRSLIPKFKVTHEEQARLREPFVRIWDGRTQYHIESNEIRFNPEHLEDPLVIGEETSHYIHLGINPLTITEQDMTLLLPSLPLCFARELVGKYGALVYTAVRGLSVNPWKRTVAFITNQTENTDHLSHELGYEHAHKFFEMHGDRYLPQVARMNPQDLIDLSRRVAPVSWYDRKVLPLIDRLRRAKS